RDFAVAIAADSTTIVISADEAKGLQPQILAALKPTDGGNYIVPVSEATIGPFLSTDASSAARERFFAAYFRRGGIGNVHRVDTALALRDTLAVALGFPNWAAYQLDTHMAKDPQRVIAFLDQIDSRLAPEARAELASLARVKRESGDTSAMQISDVSY